MRRRFEMVGLFCAVLAGLSMNIEPAAGAAVEVLSAPPVVGDASAGPVVYWQDSTVNGRAVHFIRVDLANPNYQVKTILDPNIPSDYTYDAIGLLRNPLQLANENNAVAAINANGFAYPFGSPDQQNNPGWIAGKPVHIYGLTVSDGVQYRADRASEIPLWIDSAGKAHVGHPQVGDQVQQAIASWESAPANWPLKDGEVVYNSTSRYLRTLAGTDESGRWLYLLATGSGGLGTQVSITEAASLMLERGAWNAINLDGGGSSTMLLDNGVDGALRAVSDPGYLRPLPVMLAVVEVPEPAAVALLGLAGLGLMARRRRGTTR